MPPPPLGDVPTGGLVGVLFWPVNMQMRLIRCQIKQMPPVSIKSDACIVQHTHHPEDAL